ncbi:unnamed protein product, partial [marine sediment metagenome]
LSIKESNYINQFYQGASLVPRNLFFIDVKSQTGNNFIITPNKKVGSKKPWMFIPYDEIEVERQYIFDCAKSTDLVPFSLLSTYKIFLPVEKKLNFNRKKIYPKAKILFEKLEEIYREIQEKDERKITDLWENINHLNKLTNPRQLSNIKVIYNASGSLLKAAIVKNKIIVDTTPFYISLDNINEAYYLCAILNSPILSKNIKIIKSSRHIHKRPLTFPIPFYNENNKLHSEIVSLGKLLEEKIEIIINDLKEKELNNLKNKIQCIHCEKCYNKKIPINVYLTDSLNPINEFTPIIEDKKRNKKNKFQSLDKWHTYGEVERFNMPAINDSLVINVKFFKYSEKFGELLKELDKNLVKFNVFDDLIGSIYKSIDHKWLEE